MQPAAQVFSGSQAVAQQQCKQSCHDHTIRRHHSGEQQQACLAETTGQALHRQQRSVQRFFRFLPARYVGDI